MSKVNFSVKKLDVDESPILVSFDSAPPSTKHLSNVGFDIFEDKINKKRKIKATHDDIEYEGESIKTKNNYAIGIFDKTSKKLRIIPVSKYTVQQKIKKDTPINDDEEDEKDSKKNDFVSARVQRMVQKDKKFNIKVNPKMVINPNETNDVINRDYLPLFDQNTEIRSEIYKIESIISDEDFKHLGYLKGALDSQESLQKILNDRYFPGFILKLLEKGIKEKEKKKRSVKYFQTLEYFGFLFLLVFKNGHRKKDFEYLKSTLGIRHDELLESILEKFSDKFHKSDGSTLYHIEPYYNKLMCHVAILFLHLNDFRCNTSEISQEMKRPDEEITKYFKEVGCELSKKSETDEKTRIRKTYYIAKLSAPLTFPRQMLKKLK
eukprot:gene1537-12663_t